MYDNCSSNGNDSAKQFTVKMEKGSFDKSTFKYNSGKSETKAFDCEDTADGKEQCTFYVGEIPDWKEKGFKQKNQRRQAIKFSGTAGIVKADFESYYVDEKPDPSWGPVTGGNCDFNKDPVRCVDQAGHKLNCTKGWDGRYSCKDHQGHDISWFANFINSNV